VVHGVGEPVVTGLSPDNNAALARSLGDWGDSCQTAQGGVVTSLQGIEGFCQQRGEDDPSHLYEDSRVKYSFLFSFFFFPFLRGP
jgi:hypothetical protein